MSTNKKFRIQNGVDITGEVVVGNQLVITAEGKLVLPAIEGAISDAVSADIAALQAQVDAILGTSPEHLDTLQEIVALFQSEDGDISTLITNNSTAITQIQQTLASGVATAAQGALADTAAQQADLDAVIAQITDGVATAAQGALADTAVQPEDFGAGIVQGVGVSDWSASQMGSEINVGTSYAVGMESEAIATSDLYYVTATNTNNNSNGNINLLVWDKSVASPASDGWYKDLSSSLPSDAFRVTHLEITDEYVFVGFQVNSANDSNALLAIKISDGTVYRDFKSIVDAAGQGGWTSGASGHAWKFDIDDKYIAIVDRIGSNVAIVVDYTTGQWVRNYTFTGAKDFLEVALDSGKMLVSGYRSNDQKQRTETAELVDIASGSVLHTLTRQHAQVTDPNWNGIGWGGTVLLSGDYAVVGSMYGNVRYASGKLDVFDVSTGSHIVTLSEGYNTVENRFAYGLDRGATDLYGSYLVATTSDDKAYVYDLSTSSSDALTVLTLPYKMGARVVVSSTGAVFNEAGEKTPNGSNASVVNVIVPSSTPLVVDTSVIATKEYVDSGVAGVDLSGYSTTTEMDSAIAVETAARTAAIAAIPSTDLTPYSTTAQMDSSIATAKSEAQTYADQVVAATVDAAPAALDTLNELAAALGDDANFASTVTASLADKATAAQGALADTAVQPEDFSTGFGTTVSTVIDYSSEGTFSAPSTIINATPSGESFNYGKFDGNSTHVAYYFTNPRKVSLFTKEGSLVGSTNLTKFGGFTFTEEHLAVHDAGIVTVYDMDMNVVNTFSVSMDSVNSLQPRPMVFSGDTLIVATGSAGATLKVYNWTTGADVSTISLTARTTDLKGQPSVEPTDMSVSGNKLFVGNFRGGTSYFNGGVHVVDLTSYTEINVINSPVGGNEGFGYHLESDDDYLVVYRQRMDEGYNNRVNGALELYSVSDYTHLGTIKDGTANGYNELEFAGRGDFKGFDLVDGYVIASSGQHLDNKLYFINCGDLSTHSINMESALGLNHASVGMVNVCGSDIILTFAHRTQYNGSYGHFMVKVTAESFSDTTSFVVDDSIFATKDYVDSGVAGVDLSGYSTTVEMDSAIAVETAAAIAAIPATDLTTYSTTVEMDSAIATAKSEAQTYADQVVASTVDAAPAALDTLNELAAALGDDANFASTVTASLADKVSTYTFDNRVSDLQQDINLKADKTVNFNITGAASSGSPVIINEDGTISAIGASVPVSELSELVTSDSMEITNQVENWATTVYNMTGDYPLNDNYARQRQMLVAEPIQISNDANGNERFLHAFAQGEDTHLAVYAVIDGVLTYVSRSVDHKSPGWIQVMAYNAITDKVLLVSRNHYSSKIVYTGVTISDSGAITYGSSPYSQHSRTQFPRTGNSVAVEPIADRFVCISVQSEDGYTIIEQINVTEDSEVRTTLEKIGLYSAGSGSPRTPRTNGGPIFSASKNIGTPYVSVVGNDTFPMTQDYNSDGNAEWKQRFAYGHYVKGLYITWNSTTQEFNDPKNSSNQIGAWTTIPAGDIAHVAGMYMDDNAYVYLYGFKGGHASSPNLPSHTIVKYNAQLSYRYSSNPLTLGTNTPSNAEESFHGYSTKSPRWFASEFHGSSFNQLSDGSFLLSFAYHDENVSIATISAEGVITGVVDTGYAVGSGYDNKKWYPSDIQSKSFVTSSDEMYHIITRANYDSSTSDGQADSGWATHKLGSFIPDPASYLGIAQGDNGDIVISGGVVSGFTGLIPSTIYYVQSDGALSTTETNIKAGIAISENDILVSDNLDDAKQDLSPYATKEYVDSGVAGVDLSAYSTTTQMDSAIAVETAARTAAIAAIPATDLTTYSTTVEMDSAIATAKSEVQTYADQVVAATVDSAPAALNTLNELALALGDDTNFASNVTTSIATKADAAATTAALADKANAADLADKANAADLTTLETQLSGTLGKFSADDKIIFSDTQPISEPVGSVWFDTSTQQIYKLNSVAVPGPVTITSDMFSSMSNSQSSWYAPFPNGLAPSLMFADQYEAYRVAHEYIGDNETLPIFHFQPGGIPSWDYSLSVFSESDGGYHEFTIPMDIPHFKTKGRSLGIAAVKYDNDEIVYIDRADSRDYTFTRKVKAFIVRRREYGSGNFSSTLIGFEASSHSIISWDLIDTATDLTPYSTTAEMNAAIAAIPSTDLTTYSTTVEMDSAIATAKTEAQSYADQVVASTIDAAPASLDTLNELAAALGDDANFASTVTASIATKADDAATTAALASKVGLAEVDVRMEPIKQLAESAIQPSDLGDGISSNSTTTQTWDVTTSQSVPSAPQGGEVQTVLTNGTGIFATYKGGSSTGAWGYGVYWKDLSVNQDYFIADISGSADWAKLGASSGLSDDYFVLAGQGKVAVWSTSDGSLVVEKARGLFSGSSTEFGGTVTLNGNKVIIGDFFADSEAGAVYVFDIISEQITKISNPDPSSYQKFSGASASRDKMDGISSYGNKVLVGAPYANNDSFSSDGKVFVFDINDGSLIHTLSNPNGSDTIMFGLCSTVNDNYYVVGASQTKGSIGQYPIADSGAIFIYSATDGSYISTIENPGKGVGSSDNNQYGRAVKLSDGVLFVAAERGDIGEGTDGSSDNKNGKIYLYEMSDNPTLIDTIDSPVTGGDWPLTPKLMDVSGTILVVGDISDNSSINYWSAIEVTGRAVISIDTSTIATKDYVDSGVAGVDLSGYSTTVEMDSAIAAIPVSYSHLRVPETQANLVCRLLPVIKNTLNYNYFNNPTCCTP